MRRSGLALAVITILIFSAGAPSAGAAPVSVTLIGGGEGNVKSSTHTGIDCSISAGVVTGVCGIVVPDDFSGAPTGITASAEAGSYFAGWTVGEGTCLGIASPCQLPFSTFFTPYNLTASFLELPDPPTVQTGGTEAGEGPHIGVLQGVVNPGGAAVADCRFEYGTTSEYGDVTPCMPSADELGEGTADVPVSARTEPLEPNATYHYRLRAANVGGESIGDDRTFTTGPAAADTCPNSEIRESQGIGTLLLPACMALEMVSPPKKDGHGAKGPELSIDGDRVIFRSLASLGGSPGALSFLGDPYIASRGDAGWTTVPTVPPSPYVRGWSPSAKAKSLTPDFSQWFQIAATFPQFRLGTGQVLLGSVGGGSELISPPLVPSSEAHRNTTAVEVSRLQGASTDHSLLLFQPGGTESGSGQPTSYLAHDPSPSGPAADSNTYLIDRNETPALQLLARAKGVVWGGNCGSRVGGIEIARAGESAGAGARNQGAISADGSLVYFSTRPSQPTGGPCSTANKLRILKRVSTGSGPEIHSLFASECDRVSPPCNGIDGDDLYQGASTDQTKVYFTTNRQLADTDLDSTGDLGGSACVGVSFFLGGCDLYLYDSERPLGERLTQVSAGDDVPGKHEAGSEARVLNGTVAISGDGSRVYFAAEGVLTDDESPGGVSAGDLPAATPKLYTYHRDEGDPDGSLAFLGALDQKDKGALGLWGGEGTFNNAAYPVPAAGDGRFLLFLSWGPLTDDDTDGGRRDAFRYDAETDQLVRISKAVDGGTDGGSFDVAERGLSLDNDAPGTDVAEIGRWASEDGEVVVFQTAEGLLPGDVNGMVDSYIWRAGGLHRLPGSADTFATTDNRPTLSHDGATVAFQSSKKLLPQDGDSSADIYVARADGGFPNPAPDEICVPGENCQGAAEAPPSIPQVSSGQGANVTPRKPKRCPKGKRKVVRKGKSRCIPRKSRAGTKGKKKKGRDAGAKGRASK